MLAPRSARSHSGPVKLISTYRVSAMSIVVISSSVGPPSHSSQQAMLVRVSRRRKPIWRARLHRRRPDGRCRPRHRLTDGLGERAGTARRIYHPDCPRTWRPLLLREEPAMGAVPYANAASGALRDHRLLRWMDRESIGFMDDCEHTTVRPPFKHRSYPQMGSANRLCAATLQKTSPWLAFATLESIVQPARAERMRRGR